MKRVGVREFRDRATQFLAGDDVLIIERNGQPIGFYIPTGTSRQERFTDSLERLERTVQRLLAQTGLSEEELSRLYDLRQPIPADPKHRHAEPVTDPHASGR